MPQDGTKRYASSAKERASGGVPYNLFIAQNTKGTGHSLLFYGLKISATFAQIPTCAPPERRGVWTLTIVVLAVANASAELRASLTKADNRGNVQSHGGIGQRVAKKCEVVADKTYITRRKVSVNRRRLHGKSGIAYGRGFCIDIAGRGCIK